MGKCSAQHVCAHPWLPPAPGLAFPGHRGRHASWDNTAVPGSIRPRVGEWDGKPFGATMSCTADLASWTNTTVCYAWPLKMGLQCLAAGEAEGTRTPVPPIVQQQPRPLALLVCSSSTVSLMKGHCRSEQGHPSICASLNVRVMCC